MVDIEKIKKAATYDEISNLEIKYLGRNGEINKLLSNIKDIPNQEKKAYGQKINKLKQTIEQLIAEKRQN